MRFWHRHRQQSCAYAIKSRWWLPWRLPLQRNLRLAVLGPLRNATEELLGNYQALADGSLSLLPSCSILSPSSRLGL